MCFCYLFTYSMYTEMKRQHICNPRTSELERVRFLGLPDQPQPSLLSNPLARETPFSEEWHLRLKSSLYMHTCASMYMHLHKHAHTHRERGVVARPGFNLYLPDGSQCEKHPHTRLAIFKSFENCLLELSAHFHWATIITAKILSYLCILVIILEMDERFANIPPFCKLSF